MTVMELLTIPGMSSRKVLVSEYKKSKTRLNDAAKSQMLAAALMSAARSKKTHEK